MNPYYYLFYKFNCFLNRKGDNEWGPIGAITLFIECNIIIPYVKLFHINEKNLNGIYKIILIIICILLFMTNSILFSNKMRVAEIKKRYNGESEINRKIGSFLVILYVALSLGLIIFG